MLSLNLTELKICTVYTICMSVNGEGVNDIFAKDDVITRINASGKLPC